MEMQRRTFIKGLGATALAGASLAVAGTALADEITWDQEADVVIVGSGLAGMSAAIEALNADSTVLVLEQKQIAGGASIGCQILYSWGSKSLNLPQKYEGITDDADQMYDAVMACGSNLADPDLTRVLVDNCCDGIDFLYENGCVFDTELKPVEGTQGQGAYKAASGGGATSCLINVFEERGNEVMTDCTMTDFIQNEDGRVIGVWYEDEDGNRHAAKANKAVVMASGIWVHDEEMIRREWPTISDDLMNALLTSGAKGMPFGLFEGGHIRAGQRIGAGMRHMAYINGEPYHATVELQEPGVCTEGLVREPDELHVNLEGVRFYDESITRGQMAEKILAQPEGTYFAVLDSKWIPGKLLPMSTPEAIEQWVADGYMVKADTLEELAEGMERVWGMSAETALNTLNTYNEYCANGVDEDFGKPKNFLTPLDTPPFYVSPKQTANVQMTLGGYDADVDARVHDVDGNVIPGLYAAGLCTGGHFGKDAIMGTYQMTACVFGRIAGQNAAAEESWA